MMEEWLLLKDGGICRCCALEGPSKDLVSKYSWMGDDEIYSDMLRECFNITLVTVEEGSNGGICEVCITQLRSAYKFRQHVLHTEEQFKKKLESKNLCDSAFVKLEIPPETSDTDMDPMGDNDDNSDYEVPLKKIKDELESEMELMKQKKTPAKTIASKSTRTLKKKASVEPETSKSTSKKKTVAGKEKNEYQKRFFNLKCILQYSNATLIRGQDVRGFLCFLCPMICEQADDLKNHCLSTHRDERTFRNFCPRMFEYLVKMDVSFLHCSICETEIFDLDEFIVHLKNEHKKEAYPDVKNYIFPFKFEKPGLYCCICDVKFSVFKMMIQHMHVHYKNFICDVCGAGFAIKAAHRSHKQRHADGLFPCSQCKSHFDNKYKLMSHVRQAHLKLKTYQCQICYQKFDDYVKKINHGIKVHKLVYKRHECDLCDRHYSLQKDLTAHVRKVHLGKWKHSCHVCGKLFFDKSLLTDHLVVHGVGKTNFTCDLCSKVYSRKRALEVHMKIHVTKMQQSKM